MRTASGSVSHSRVASSSPAKPAPRMRTCRFTVARVYFGASEPTCAMCHAGATGASPGVPADDRPLADAARPCLRRPRRQLAAAQSRAPAPASTRTLADLLLPSAAPTESHWAVGVWRLARRRRSARRGYPSRLPYSGEVPMVRLLDTSCSTSHSANTTTGSPAPRPPRAIAVPPQWCGHSPLCL